MEKTKNNKTKIASKNNPEGRGQRAEHLYEGKKIRPVKFISGSSSILAAEYEDSGEIVVDGNGIVLSWNKVNNI